MGLHRDGEILGLNPYETEMRRRVWWQIVALDSMYSATTGIKPTSLLSVADTNMPHNVNDTDFSTESTVIQPREGGTEMAFVMIIYQLIKFITEHQAADFEHLLLGGVGAEPGTPEYQTYQEVLHEFRGVIDEFDATLAEAERKYCDQTGGPLHALALFLRPNILKEGRAMGTSMEETPEWGTEVKTPKDNFFRIWLTHHEGALGVYKMANQGGFTWAFKSHFHLDALVFLAGQLAERSPLGSFAERTWRVFDGFYHYHEELWNLTQKAHVQLARVLLKAWEAREATTEAPVDVPVFVPKLKMALLQAGLCWPRQNATLPQPVEQGILMSDLQFGEVLSDMPTMLLDWSVADDQQLVDAQNPALPIFAFFNGTTSW